LVWWGFGGVTISVGPSCGSQQQPAEDRHSAPSSLLPLTSFPLAPLTPTPLTPTPLHCCPRFYPPHPTDANPSPTPPRLPKVAWQRLRDSVRIPLYGCDCYAYGLLASGHCDLVVEADLKPYDYMALVPVIQVCCVWGVGVGGWGRWQSFEGERGYVRFFVLIVPLASAQHGLFSTQSAWTPPPPRSEPQGAGGVITDWAGQPLRWHPESAAAQVSPGEVLAAGDARAHAQAMKVLDWR